MKRKDKKQRISLSFEKSLFTFNGVCKFLICQMLIASYSIPFSTEISFLIKIKIELNNCCLMQTKMNMYYVEGYHFIWYILISTYNTLLRMQICGQKSILFHSNVCYWIRWYCVCIFFWYISWKNVIAAYNCMTRKKSVRGKKRNVMLSFIVLMDHVVASKTSSK